MQHHKSKKLRFGCGASLNSRLKPVSRNSEEVKYDSSKKSDKNSQRSMTEKATGYKQE
jgi:hypothetical protein